MVDFYVKNLGFQTSPSMQGVIGGKNFSLMTNESNASARFAFLIQKNQGRNSFVIEIIEFINPKGGGHPVTKIMDPMFNFLSFWVDDIQEAVKDLRSKGMVFLSDPVKMENGEFMAVSSDPEGNRIEILEPPKSIVFNLT